MSLLWVNAARSYFHGSDREFEPGDLIRPQRETGAKTWAEQLGYDSPTVNPHYSGEHVYHADAIHKAQDFGRHVYEVEPLSDPERDPESQIPGYPDQGWTRNKGSARVIRKVHTTPRGAW